MWKRAIQEIIFIFAAMLTGLAIACGVLYMFGQFHAPYNTRSEISQIYSDIRDLKNMQLKQDLLFNTGKFVITDGHEILFSGSAEEIAEIYDRLLQETIHIKYTGKLRVMEEKYPELGEW
jgi:hypothetical protein